MAQRLLIVGAGGFGREVLAWAEDIARAEVFPRWREVAFLDANPDALRGYELGAPVVGDPATYAPLAGDRFACAIGDPATKLSVCRSLRERGAAFVSLIHPTALVGPRTRLGEGVVLCPGATVTVDATLGDFVALNARAGVGHDAVLGDGCTVSAYCDITGQCRLGEGVFLGTHAVMLPRSVAGDYAKIAAGSVVYRRAPAGATVSGAPAKRLAFPAA